MKAEKTFVTIFILVYNNADGLDKTVQSVIDQTYENVEVILSDDGSKNYDISILERYAEKIRTRYDKVYVNVNEQNLGTVKHLNRVIKMAKGKYLFNCCSGDSFCNKDTVAKLVDEFEKSGSLILATRRKDLYDNGKTKLRPAWFYGFALQHCPMQLLDYMVCKKNVISGSCTFCSKELFETYGYYDEDYHLVEDYPYYVMLLQKKVKFGWTSMPSICHEIGGVSTGKVHPSIYKDIELMREKMYMQKELYSKKIQVFLEQNHNVNE